MVNHDMKNKLELPLCLLVICIVNTDVMKTDTFVKMNLNNLNKTYTQFDNTQNAKRDTL